MTRFRHSTGISQLEEQLRREHPRPPRELEELLTTYVGYRPRERRLAPRLVGVVAFTAATAAVLGALVGVGQAASGPQNAVTAVVNVLSTSASSGAGAPSAGTATAGTATAGSSSSASTSASTTTSPPASVSTSSSTTSDNSPANDQYKPGKGCGDTNHVHARENECKKLK